MARNLKAFTNVAQKLTLVQPETVTPVSLAEAGYDESWLQEQLQQHAQLLGLGVFLDCRDTERLNARGGHIDMIFQDRETETRYCVEVVLGEVDETDFIRAIEFWEEERARHFHYKCIPVIVTESVPTRIFTSIAARSIPLIAIRMNGIKKDDSFILNFVPVLDYSGRTIADDSDKKWHTAARKDWLEKCSPGATKAIDEYLDYCRKLDPGVRVTYHRGHIAVGGAQTHNFCWLYTHEENEWIRLGLYLNQSDRQDAIMELDGAGIDWQITSTNILRFNVRPGDIEKHGAMFRRFVNNAIHASQ